jgi:hypothetical protein
MVVFFIYTVRSIKMHLYTALVTAAEFLCLVFLEAMKISTSAGHSEFRKSGRKACAHLLELCHH